MKLKSSLFAFALAALMPGAAFAQKAEVIHWWTSAGESAALKVFADKFNAQGGTWVDTAVAGGVNARTLAINRVVGGNPPTAMQFNTGKQFDDLVAGNLLNDIDAIAKQDNWAKVMPAPLLEASSRNGKLFAVPVSIHGQNWLWYNSAVLEKAGVAPPTTVEDFIAALEKVKAQGVIPLAFAGQKNWERGLFNAILLAQGGRDLYLRVYGKRDAEAVKTPEFRKVAESYMALKKYTDNGSSGRNWNDATNLVITGKAAFQFMGDWAKGEFTNAKLTPGKEYGCTVLGTERVLVMGGDVFVFAKTSNADQIKAQAMLARSFVDPATQVEFSKKKGSIPVRSDADPSTLDACAKKGIELLADTAKQTPAVELLVPASVTGALEDLISEIWNNPNSKVDSFVARFADTLKNAI